MEQIILSDRNGCKQIVDTLKYQWLRDVLEECGIDLTNCFPESEDGEQTIQQKSQLRKILKENDIFVMDDNETCTIYIQDQIIGKWEKPEYVLKKDLSKIDKTKQMYIEIKIMYSSVFDENTE